MKIKLLLLLVIALICLSCSDNIDPVTEGQKKIIFNCVIDVDDSVHFAYLTRSYSADDANNYSSKENYIKNALIRIWNGENYTVFKDSMVSDINNLPNGMPAYFYYLKNYKINPKYQLIVEAILPSGERIYVTSKSPAVVNVDKSDKLISEGSKSFLIVWERSNLNNLFLPRLSVTYQQTTSNGIVEKTIFVPQKYVTSDNKETPIYPIISNQGFLSIDKSTIDETMSNISEGDPNKDNYRIIGASIEVFSFDQNLENYLLATYKGSSAYTVNLNEVNYSNITNGLGLFGSYIRYYSFIPIGENYIKSFGYRP